MLNIKKKYTIFKEIERFALNNFFTPHARIAVIKDQQIDAELHWSSYWSLGYRKSLTRCQW